MSEHLWNKSPVRFLRWIVFLPLSLIACVLLNAIGVHAFASGWIHWPSFSTAQLSWSPSSWHLFMSKMLPFGLVVPGACLWLAAVVLTPWLGCVVVAPNRKVAAPILGTAFCIGQTSLLLNRFDRLGELSGMFLAGQVLFTVLLLLGVIQAYCALPPEGPQ